VRVVSFMCQRVHFFLLFPQLTFFYNYFTIVSFLLSFIKLQPLTAETRIQSQASSCGIHGEQSGVSCAPVSIIRLELHACSLIHHARYVISPIGSVVESLAFISSSTHYLTPYALRTVTALTENGRLGGGGGQVL
jgi:hypothetical protein